MRSTASSARPSNRATRHPKFVARLTLIMALDGSARLRRALHRALSVSLVVIRLTVQAPAAPQVIPGMAAHWRAAAALWLRSSALGDRRGALFTGAHTP